MNRKSEGNQRKNFPSKDEIIHIHLKGMRNGARYLPISIGFGLCLVDSFGNLTACPGENKVNDNTVSSPSSNFVSEMFRFVETFQIRMNEASHLISARQKSVGEVHYFCTYKKAESYFLLILLSTNFFLLDEIIKPIRYKQFIHCINKIFFGNSTYIKSICKKDIFF